MHDHEHKVKHCKAKTYGKDYALVLALLMGRKVSLDEAWRVLSPKRSLLKSDVRTYTP
jgi:hypothetical protein